ncbi:hypothetical protein cypCar_00046180 [Cyprinus carpio]|nr:hypothetical protein cypCar_00046180 [Cyprinus carpio]
MEQSDHYDRGSDHAVTSALAAGTSGQHSLQLEISDTEAEERVREEDEEEELVVLDPEHPLMKIFQSALKNNLSNQLERLNLELCEKSKVDSLALKLLYMQEANADLHSDIKAIINASHKAQKERTQTEAHKHQQDLYVECLTKHVEKLSEQISLYDVQNITQTEQTKAVKEALSEAQLELDSVIVEHRQLLQQWNSSLLMMRRRDEAYTAMQEELRLANDQVRSLDTEIEGYKKSITQEEEQNEHLTLHLNRAQNDGTTSRKLITHSQNHQEDHKVLQSEIEGLKKQMEKESAVRVDLEDQIMNKLQEQLTHNNAAK